LSHKSQWCVLKHQNQEIGFHNIWFAELRHFIEQNNIYTLSVAVLHIALGQSKRRIKYH
jgi:hypothetical protein